MPNFSAQDKAQLSSAHVFIVRVWCEDLGAGRREWRGKVQQVATGEGEARYFRDWAVLVMGIQEMLDGDPPQR